jgi:hypothetical protein
MAQQAADHHVLKAIVIGLGVLIVLGLGALVFGLTARSGRLASGGGTAPPLTLPRDASIAGMTMSERQLVLHIRMAAREELLLVDLPSGRVAGRIPILRDDAVLPQERAH